eukprot:Cvel_10002.t1-p1 / transcript=Cvel_10002.t1 / gene=Cvel_10002 / organism=Chromera_velia_CCMP2878 / gene_product=hypothetical protein / transcript_product=hypothetical protein / location=Cvel_scaffold592:70673-77869(+) / protein_length=798 / sequence_SO=supercontig / SO=protein_coding / is_pseudo=false
MEDPQEWRLQWQSGQNSAGGSQSDCSGDQQITQDSDADASSGSFPPYRQSATAEPSIFPPQRPGHGNGSMGGPGDGFPLSNGGGEGSGRARGMSTMFDCRDLNCPGRKIVRRAVDTLQRQGYRTYSALLPPSSSSSSSFSLSPPPDQCLKMLVKKVGGDGKAQQRPEHFISLHEAAVSLLGQNFAGLDSSSCLDPLCPFFPPLMETDDAQVQEVARQKRQMMPSQRELLLMLPESEAHEWERNTIESGKTRTEELKNKAYRVKYRTGRFYRCRKMRWEVHAPSPAVRTSGGLLERVRPDQPKRNAFLYRGVPMAFFWFFPRTGREEDGDDGLEGQPGDVLMASIVRGARGPETIMRPGGGGRPSWGGRRGGWGVGGKTGAEAQAEVCSFGFFERWRREKSLRQPGSCQSDLTGCPVTIPLPLPPPARQTGSSAESLPVVVFESLGLLGSSGGAPSSASASDKQKNNCRVSEEFLELLWNDDVGDVAPPAVSSRGSEEFEARGRRRQRRSVVRVTGANYRTCFLFACHLAEALDASQGRRRGRTVDLSLCQQRQGGRENHVGEGGGFLRRKRRFRRRNHAIFLDLELPSQHLNLGGDSESAESDFLLVVFLVCPDILTGSCLSAVSVCVDANWQSPESEEEGGGGDGSLSSAPAARRSMAAEEDEDEELEGLLDGWGEGEDWKTTAWALTSACPLRDLVCQDIDAFYRLVSGLGGQGAAEVLGLRDGNYPCGDCVWVGPFAQESFVDMRTVFSHKLQVRQYFMDHHPELEDLGEKWARTASKETAPWNWKEPHETLRSC